MDDPYTMEVRLCDDDGMVSEVPVNPKPALAPDGLTYLGLINMWLRRTAAARGDKAEVADTPFVCTGHAHLIGEHIRCTSSAHSKPAEPTYVVGYALNGWQVSTAPPFTTQTFTSR